jgi:hypothetical protein
MRRTLIAAVGLVVMSLVVGATVLRPQVAQAAQGIADVFVTNDATHPLPTREQNVDTNGNIKVDEQGTANVNITNPTLPVTGTVNVGNFPGSQNVSGTVNVGNLPSTQKVTGSVSNSDQTTLLYSTPGVVFGNDTGAQVPLIPDTNVTSAREVRFSFQCNGSSSACANVYVTVWADGMDALDAFQLGNSPYGSKTYDIPGVTLQALAVNTSSSISFVAQLVGRSN